MSSASTHVLDISLGRPAAGIPVTFEQEVDGGWHQLTSHVTDADGRIKHLAAARLQPGTYRISFATETYFKAQAIAGLYPLVQIIFAIRGDDAHYHMPLLLTANGYSTYRGS